MSSHSFTLIFRNSSSTLSWNHFYTPLSNLLFQEYNLVFLGHALYYINASLHFPHFKSLDHISAYPLRLLSTEGVVENMSRPGDWNCRSCNHLNFQRRDSCQKCCDPRQLRGGVTDYSAIFGGGRMTGGSTFGFTTGPDVRHGDWYCSVRNCCAHNFASRSSCFKCGALKEELSGGGFESDFGRGMGLIGSSGGGRSGWKSGDWLCSRPECNEHNYASRMECFRCNKPRDIAGRSSFILKSGDSS